MVMETTEIILLVIITLAMFSNVITSIMLLHMLKRIEKKEEALNEK